MEAKDTVMRDFDKTKVYYPGEVEVKLEIQAEISFKAGIREVADWLHDWHRDVENMVEWQAQLKEWGM